MKFDKDQKYNYLYLEFEVLNGNATEGAIQFNDWAQSEPEASDGKQESWFNFSNTEVNRITIPVTADLSKGTGELLLRFGHSGSMIGNCEILVKRVSLVNSAYQTAGFNNYGLVGLNQYNKTNDFTSRIGSDGLHFNFTASETGQWDAYTLNFDKSKKYSSFEIEFEVIKGNCKQFQYEISTWEKDNNASSQNEWIGYSESYSKVFAITENQYDGVLYLKFGIDGAAAGECEILVTKMILKEAI